MHIQKEKNQITVDLGHIMKDDYVLKYCAVIDRRIFNGKLEIHNSIFHFPTIFHAVLSVLTFTSIMFIALDFDLYGRFIFLSILKEFLSKVPFLV